MPCYDSRNDPSYVIKEALEDFNHNSPVAEYLCEVLTMLEAAYTDLNHEVSPQVMKWWEEHKRRDRKRNKKWSRKTVR